jgi:hypothetical protein
LCDRVEDIRGAGAELVVVGNGSPQQARWFVEEQRVPVRVLTDPERRAFRAIGARRGLASSLRPGTLRSALRARRRGFRQSATMGDPLQQGAVWVIAPGGKVLFRHTSRWAGDHPAPDEILAALGGRVAGGEAPSA